MAALDSALGKDFGLSRIPGFDKSGDFPFFTAGPVGLASTTPTRATKRCARLTCSGSRAASIAPNGPPTPAPRPPTMCVPCCGSSPSDLEGAAQAPLDKYFGGTEVATMRTSASDPNAMFVGLKAGDNAANHSHLDLGTWVLDALGERWIFNFGGDDYNLPGYFGKERWEYYRLRAEGHNTLIFNPGASPDQEPRAKAKIDIFKPSPAPPTPSPTSRPLPKI
jgi:hypothetical protein